MTPGVLLAAAGAAAGVVAAWDLLGAAQDAAEAVRRAVRPLASGAAAEPSRAERRRLTVLLAGALLAGGWLVAGPVAAVTLGAAGPLAAQVLLAARRRRWRAALEAGAPTVARALADALAGGHSIRGALVEAGIGGGLTGPAAAELRQVAHALTLGEPTDAVVERWRARAGAPAYDTLVAAILLQRDAGGDLAALLRGLACSLEASVRVERDARAATAQARFTGLLVTGLPAGAAGLAELAQPGYLATLLAEPVTAAMLATAAVLQLGGLLLVRRLGRTR